MKNLFILFIVFASCKPTQNSSSTIIEAPSGSNSAKHPVEKVYQGDNSVAGDFLNAFMAKAKHSNKLVTWYEENRWLDGTPITDARCNDILFTKRNGKFYKAQVDVHNVQDWNVKPENADNAPALQAMINYFPEGYAANIYIPTGSKEYYFKKEITFYRRPFYIHGDSGSINSRYATILRFEPGVMGFQFIRGNTSIQNGILERVCFVAGAKKGAVADGINVLSVMTIRDCSVKGFSRNNITLWANIGEGNDVSGSTIDNCRLSEPGESNIVCWGEDANAVNIMNLDARDAPVYNIEDRSFLGINVVNAMLHGAGKGNVYVRDWNNTLSNFINVYIEEGSPTSQLGNYSTVTGGRWSSGYKLGSDKTIYRGGTKPK